MAVPSDDGDAGPSEMTAAVRVCGRPTATRMDAAALAATEATGVAPLACFDEGAAEVALGMATVPLVTPFSA